ncbi:MAG: SCO family protein [Proteobacteria bacterium]|nr:SCO family protein [Pseudomonadota bacterium]
MIMRFSSIILNTLVAYWLSFSVSLAAAPIPTLEGTDQNGAPFKLESLRGKHILISFVFTSCPMPKMCPLTMRLNRQTQELWKKNFKEALHLLIVTLDPEGDTPELLKKFGQKHGIDLKQASLVTGNPQVLSDFGSAFNVAGWPSGNTTVHNLKTILVSPALEELQQYKENEWSAEQLIKDARGFLKKP